PGAPRGAEVTGQQVAEPLEEPDDHVDVEVQVGDALVDELLLVGRGALDEVLQRVDRAVDEHVHEEERHGEGGDPGRDAAEEEVQHGGLPRVGREACRPGSYPADVQVDVGRGRGLTPGAAGRPTGYARTARAPRVATHGALVVR